MQRFMQFVRPEKSSEKIAMNYCEMRGSKTICSNCQQIALFVATNFSNCRLIGNYPTRMRMKYACCNHF